jgi:phosphatidylglycerol---prolipoprotein diacylglyceryl transferase
MNSAGQPSLYGGLMLLGIFISLFFWRRLARRDERLLPIYLGALCGAFIGAKVVYLLAEGWLFWGKDNWWQYWLTGKTILGALLGGYISVEFVKSAVKYRQPTGDWFATIVPVSIIFGRIGCWSHGCCGGIACPTSWYTITDAAGVARWPSVQVEIVFNVAAILAFAVLRARHRLPGQHFHLYLIGYGLFRFGHEFLRDTPRIILGITGYQIAALMVAGLGMWGFSKRAKEPITIRETPTASLHPPHAGSPPSAPV